MKITVKQLKQLIREQVEEMAAGMPEARRRRAAPQVSVREPEGLAEVMDELGYGSKYIALSPERVLVPSDETPGEYWTLEYEYDGGWVLGAGPVKVQDAEV